MVRLIRYRIGFIYLCLRLLLPHSNDSTAIFLNTPPFISRMVQTESFITQKDSTSLMTRWGELSWNEIYAGHTPLVKKVLSEADLIAYITRTHSPKTVKRIENHCIEGLKSLVDDLRAKCPASAQPQECDWTLIILNPERHVPIEQRLLNDTQLKHTFKKRHPAESYNIAKAISDEYATQVNNINNETDF